MNFDKYIFKWVSSVSLTLSAPRISESWLKIKINLNFYFHTSLWCLNRFYEGLKGLLKTFWGTTEKYENKNLSEFFSLRLWSGRKGLINLSDNLLTETYWPVIYFLFLISFLSIGLTTDFLRFLKKSKKASESAFKILTCNLLFLLSFLSIRPTIAVFAFSEKVQQLKP